MGLFNMNGGLMASISYPSNPTFISHESTMIPLRSNFYSVLGFIPLRINPRILNWVWVNTCRYIFSGMNIHLPAILGFTRYQGFDPSPIKETTVWKTTLLWKSPCEGKVKHQTKWTIYTSSQTLSSLEGKSPWNLDFSPLNLAESPFKS